MRLVDGATAIRGDLPAAATRTVKVPAEAGDKQETGIARFTSVRAVRTALRRELGLVDDIALTIGGDCGVELAAIAHAMQRSSGDMALVWFDAHADLHTPASSESGTFHGMVLRTIMGDGDAGLVPAAAETVPAGRVVLAGIRSCDSAEDTFITESGIRCLSPAELEDTEALIDAIAATGATSVYLHVDLDVLDPADIHGVDFPEPFGVPAANLVALIGAVRSRFPLTGAGITEFAPATPDDADADLPTILRVIGALTK